MKLARAGLLALLLWPALRAQDRAPFATAGWSNVHDQDCGRMVVTLLGEARVSPARALFSFVSRPADHAADGAGRDGEGVRRERLGFPVMLYGPPPRGLGPRLPLCLPKDFDEAFQPLSCDPPVLLRRAVEHSVEVAVQRDAQGRIVAIGAGPGAAPAAIGSGIEVPAADAAILAGWHAPYLDAARESLPSPLREIASHAPPIPLVVGLRARIEDTSHPGEGEEPLRSEDELEGSVAADGRFQLVTRAKCLTEDDETVTVAFELACDLRALSLGVREWPTRCVWPADHPRFSDVLRTEARVALPLIAWARDPYWFAPCSALVCEIAPMGELVRVDESAPDEGLLGTVRHLVDERSDPPTLRSLAVLGPDGTLVLEHRYEDDRELAPGYRRPMRIVTRRFDPRTGRVVRERIVTILAARIGTAAEAKRLGLELRGSDLRLMR